MRRNSDARRGERIENLGYGLIAAALFASSAMAFVGAPLPIPAQRAAEVIQVRLEGLVVTPTRTYRASEWALRRAAPDEVVLAPDTDNRLQRCRLPQPASRAQTLHC